MRPPRLRPPRGQAPLAVLAVLHGVAEGRLARRRRVLVRRRSRASRAPGVRREAVRGRLPAAGGSERAVQELRQCPEGDGTIGGGVPGYRPGSASGPGRVRRSGVLALGGAEGQAVVLAAPAAVGRCGQARSAPVGADGSGGLHHDGPRPPGRPRRDAAHPGPARLRDPAAAGRPHQPHAGQGRHPLAGGPLGDRSAHGRPPGQGPEHDLPSPVAAVRTPSGRRPRVGAPAHGDPTQRPQPTPRRWGRRPQRRARPLAAARRPGAHPAAVLVRCLHGAVAVRRLRGSLVRDVPAHAAGRGTPAGEGRTSGHDDVPEVAGRPRPRHQ